MFLEGQLGEDEVVKRALNLLRDFPDLKLYTQKNGVVVQVKKFLQKKNEHCQRIAELRKQARTVPYVRREVAMA